jgi:hypothetical protein
LGIYEFSAQTGFCKTEGGIVELSSRPTILSSHPKAQSISVNPELIVTMRSTGNSIVSVLFAMSVMVRIGVGVGVGVGVGTGTYGVEVELGVEDGVGVGEGEGEGVVAGCSVGVGLGVGAGKDDDGV